MDPFSQGFLGSALSQASAKKDFIKKATICGAIGGILPDADIFIRSKTDTLLAIEYHRHFTHSLAFIPIGGFVAALLCILLFRLFKSDIGFKKAYMFATLGYATHALLDACTSYGTHLWLPFSNERVSWSIISVVDPLYTIPMAILVILTHKRRDKKYLKYFLIFTICYFSLGYLQNKRVTEEMYRLANSRGHQIEHYEVKPTIGNNILWRTTYRAGDRIYVDAIRSNWLGDIKIYEGRSLKATIFPKYFSVLDGGSVLYNDIRRFNFFSNSLIGISEDYPDILIDARYSSVANGIAPMWGLTYDVEQPEKRGVFKHYKRNFSNEETYSQFFDMLVGK